MVWERVAAAVFGPTRAITPTPASTATAASSQERGPVTAAGQAPQSLPQHSPSARVTALAGELPGQRGDPGGRRVLRQ
ncbi:hypothetical protein MAHJHV29_48410 [Mycobacterium avium subsp. hominissuis]